MFKLAMISGRETYDNYKSLKVDDLVDLVSTQCGKRVREVVERGKVGFDFAVMAYTLYNKLKLHTVKQEWRKYGVDGNAVSVSIIAKEHKPDVWVLVADTGPLGKEITRLEELSVVRGKLVNLDNVYTAKKQGDIWLLYNGIRKEYLDTQEEGYTT